MKDVIIESPSGITSDVEVHPVRSSNDETNKVSESETKELAPENNLGYAYEETTDVENVGESSQLMSSSDSETYDKNSPSLAAQGVASRKGISSEKNNNSNEDDGGEFFRDDIKVGSIVLRGSDIIIESVDSIKIFPTPLAIQQEKLIKIKEETLPVPLNRGIREKHIRSTGKWVTQNMMQNGLVMFVRNPMNLDNERHYAFRVTKVTKTFISGEVIPDFTKEEWEDAIVERYREAIMETARELGRDALSKSFQIKPALNVRNEYKFRTNMGDKSINSETEETARRSILKRYKEVKKDSMVLVSVNGINERFRSVGIEI
jgi:hypothetical protein